MTPKRYTLLVDLDDLAGDLLPPAGDELTLAGAVALLHGPYDVYLVKDLGRLAGSRGAYENLLDELFYTDEAGPYMRDRIIYTPDKQLLRGDYFFGKQLSEEQRLGDNRGQLVPVGSEWVPDWDRAVDWMLERLPGYPVFEPTATVEAEFLLRVIHQGKAYRRLENGCMDVWNNEDESRCYYHNDTRKVSKRYVFRSSADYKYYQVNTIRDGDELLLSAGHDNYTKDGELTLRRALPRQEKRTFYV
jgi:hypothetical protein